MADPIEHGQHPDQLARMRQYEEWSGARRVVPGESLTHPPQRVQGPVMSSIEERGPEHLQTIRTMLANPLVKKVQYDVHHDRELAVYLREQLTAEESARVSIQGIGPDMMGL